MQTLKLTVSAVFLYTLRGQKRAVMCIRIDICYTSSALKTSCIELVTG